MKRVFCWEDGELCRAWSRPEYLFDFTFKVIYHGGTGGGCVCVCVSPSPHLPCKFLRALKLVSGLLTCVLVAPGPGKKVPVLPVWD